MSGPSAVDLWQEKLDHLLAEEAKASDPEVKFNLKQRIAETRRKLQELKATDPTCTSAAPVSKLVYCRRCGQASGKQSICTGAYTHHEFFSGFVHDYCERCGVRPGAQTICTGAYTNHVFASGGSKLVICSRCGVRPGAQTICTGAYTHHNFIQT